ncbi:acyltransferase family protein [Butyrivibrio sp. FCS006]|uniref:acyltransferase family protein n=1 Tax=Butyrivibrio sp. FCS006 TaxID=1280684 RepID=UPI00040C77CE|nr:acyltransferase [Butyrivibrio sp. FCS006]
MPKGKYYIKNTLGMFNLYKGFAMIFMIMHHTYEKVPVIGILQMVSPPFIVSAAMPALFVISGYGFRKTTNKKCVVKQWNTLIIPFIYVLISVTIVHFLYYFFVFGERRVAIEETAKIFMITALGITYENFLGFNLPMCGPIWFILALALGNILFNFLLNHLEGIKLLIAAAGVATLGWIIGLFVILPWCILQGMIATFFICIGYFVKKNKLFTTSWSTRQKVLSIGTILVLNIIAMIAGDKCIMAYNYYSHGIITIIFNGISAVFVIYCFLYLNRFDGIISNAIRNIGRLSLYVYCIHSVEYMGFGRYFQYDLANNWKWHPALYSLSLFCGRLFLVLVATYFLVWIKGIIENREKK